MKSLYPVLVIVVASLVATSALAAEGPPVLSTAAWQQLSPTRMFSLAVERERYTTLDRSARLVFFVEAGKDGPALNTLQVSWSVHSGNRLVAQQQNKIDRGLLCVDVGLASLAPGRYEVTGQLMSGPQKLTEQTSFFRVEKVDPPVQEGRVPLVLPAGVRLKEGTWPVQAGVPFPKGAVWNPSQVRLVDAQGNPVPCGLTVRSRWGSGEASVRWLGVDLQASAAEAWWPKREKPSYFLEFGPKVTPTTASAIKAADRPDGIAVDTGAISFLVRRKGFNLVDEVTLGGRTVNRTTTLQGLYLIDHEGSVYRAANDANVKVTIEEQNDLRVVVRAEGWYVKDGTTGKVQSPMLPTDKLCRFITRVEAYAGKPYVRVLSTWINTFDTFTVRLKDIGIALPLAARQATFGVDGKDPIVSPVSAGGVRLVQHLHDQFMVEDGAGKRLATGAKSAGWMAAQGDSGSLTISHRDTWQRFPKEIEVLPDTVRLHVWPAHGKEHPEINVFAKDQIHRLWFAHQGKELNMAMPWDYYFAVSEYAPLDNYGQPGPQAFAGVQAYAMGTGVTSDFLVHFAGPGEDKTMVPMAKCFQAAPHALADPNWTCDSLAMGYIHPYDPKSFRGFEEMISNGMRGYWETQNDGKMFGMWIYRSWQHSAYNDDGSWVHYRLFNGTHHGEAIMPWVFYARSGDPFYLAQGRANIRQLSDVQIVHHADLEYERKIGVNLVQGKLVGATKHDNCVALWGGDHEVFGHQPCYNGLILAYYMTGDLRLREVLVDEWQHTITTGRDLPPIQSPYGDCASALAQGRDNSNPVSDLIDLYQLTYDPRTLAVLKPRLDIFLYGPPNKGPSALYTAWGHALHNIILFHGMDDVRQSLLKLMAGPRDGKAPASGTARPDSPARVPGQVWDSFEPYRAEEAYAMATILDPQSPHAAGAMSGRAQSRMMLQKLARAESRHSMPLSQVADHLRPLPRLMYALMHSTRRDLAGVLDEAQPLPNTWTKTPFRVIVRESQDQEIKVHIIGTVKEAKGIEVQAFGPGGVLISRTTVPPGLHASFDIALPRDGKTGDYVLLVARGNDDLSIPLTTLPEVYPLKEWITFGGGLHPAQYFTRSPDGQPCDISMSSESMQMLSFDRKVILGFTTKQKKIETVRIGPDGAWFSGNAGVSSYRDNPSPVIVSARPERWFVPDPAALSIQPAP